MQYVSPITKDNDIVNKKYVDESVSAVNSEIEKVNTSLEQIGSLTDLETTSKDNLVGAINEVMSNIPDLSEVTSQIGTLENLTTEDKTSLVNAINEVASKGGGVNMTVTTLYSGSYNGNTFTESIESYDIVVVYGTGIYYANKNYGWILSSPIMFFPKLNLTYYTASFSRVNHESSNAAGIFDKGTTPYYRLNDKSLSIGSSSSNPSHGTITVYGIKLGG